MKLKTRSLRLNFLLYFLLFSIIILVFLYFFQILFLNSYYKINQANNLNNTLITIKKEFSKKDSSLDLEKLSEDNDICLSIVSGNEIIYHTRYSKNCYKTKQILSQIEKDYINSGKNNLKLEISNKNRKSKILLYGKKLNETTYVLASSPITPMDRSITLLKKQFIYVTIVILLLSFIISYFFSRRLSNPIEKINIMAKKLSKKDYKIKFKTDTEIAELKELSNTLNKARVELGKAEELQRELIANISHDLKTPLTMIKAYASSAKDLHYNNKQKLFQDLNIIIDETERLNNLVNDILLLSKMQSKTNELNKEKINITKLINEILERFTIYKQQGYSLIFKEEKDYFIKADKKQLERVIYNLIINAINYTGEDKKVIIKLEIKKDTITLKVTDTGKGITGENKKLVWNKYFRINKRHRRTNIGTGLGLSIVKEILENHNFQYGVISKKDKGSTFYFTCNIENKEK